MLSLSYRQSDWIELPLDGKLRKPSPKNERHAYLTELELAELLEAVVMTPWFLHTSSS
ncbi:hypothetical protein NFI08_22245 [Halomonas sp. EF61]|uniref:hypothetical protein n=1 Tax=Halomonas sp. EF61 TaxID=2950869 RepID=UPI0032DE3228